MPPLLPPPLFRHLALRLILMFSFPASATVHGSMPTGVRGTHLDNFPNKPRHWLEFHLSDVLIQHFHKHLVIWLWKHDSREQIRYNSLGVRIERGGQDGLSAVWLYTVLKWDLHKLHKIPNLVSPAPKLSHNYIFWHHLFHMISLPNYVKSQQIFNEPVLCSIPCTGNE